MVQQKWGLPRLELWWQMYDQLHETDIDKMIAFKLNKFILCLFDWKIMTLNIFIWSQPKH